MPSFHWFWVSFFLSLQIAILYCSLRPILKDRPENFWWWVQLNRNLNPVSVGLSVGISMMQPYKKGFNVVVWLSWVITYAVIVLLSFDPSGNDGFRNAMVPYGNADFEEVPDYKKFSVESPYYFVLVPVYAIINYFVCGKARELRKGGFMSIPLVNSILPSLLGTMISSLLAQSYVSSPLLKCLAKVGNDIEMGWATNGNKYALVCEDAQQTATSMCCLVGVVGFIKIYVLPFDANVYGWDSVVRFHFNFRHQVRCTRARSEAAGAI